MERDIIGIFLGKNKIIAASVNKRKEYRQIGFQGEIEYFYQSTADIDDCVTCLESTYNVDTLSELDVTIYVIDCGADLSLKNYLLQKIKDCRRVSSVFVEDLLYAATVKNKLIKAKCKMELDFLDKNTYICDDDFQWIKSDIDSAEIILSIKDIMMSFIFDIRNYQTDDTELKNKLFEAEKNWAIEKDELLKKLKNSLALNSIFQIENMRKIKEKDDMVKKRKFVMIEFEDCKGEIQISKETCTIVSAKDTIAWVIREKGKKNYTDTFRLLGGVDNGRKKRTRVNAGFDGKIGWLIPNNDKVKNHIDDYYKWSGHMIPIAVISDVNDDVEAMIKWGKSQDVKFK